MKLAHEIAKKLHAVSAPVDAPGTTTFAYDTFGSLTNETVVDVAGTSLTGLDPSI